MADLTTNVRYIKGIGEQRAKSLEKLGIQTLRDLISWFPRKYDDRTEMKKISELVPGESACVAAIILLLTTARWQPRAFRAANVSGMPS